MLLKIWVLGLSWCTAPVLAAPTILAASSSQQPPCSYPIGGRGKFAKVAGRLFDIDGKVGYFAGGYL